MSAGAFERDYTRILTERLAEPRRFIQVVAGARQVGKTTLVGQVLRRLDGPSVFVSADEPTVGDSSWLAAQWERARLATASAEDRTAILVLDEVQKIAGWSEAVKRLWDEDTRLGRAIKVVVLGSAPLLMQQGLTESLAGRFEIVHLPHWTFGEMRAAFGFSLDQYLYFGGYPGAAPLIGDPPRWRRYVLDSLIETTIARDVLLMNRVDRPVLLRRVFELGCRYSGQVLLVHEDAGAAARCRKCHDPGALPGSAVWSGNGHRPAEVFWRGHPSTRVEPQAASPQHCADDGAVRPDP